VAGIALSAILILAVALVGTAQPTPRAAHDDTSALLVLLLSVRNASDPSPEPSRRDREIVRAETPHCLDASASPRSPGLAAAARRGARCSAR
jgi:hypothetical protein